MPGTGVGVTPRVAKATIAKWARKVSEITIRKLVLLSLLKSKGRIEYGLDGGEIRWPVRVSEFQLQDFPDMTPINYDRRTTIENAYLPWRGYIGTEAISLREKLQNRGPSAMVKVFDQRKDQIQSDLTRHLAKEFYTDGNATGNGSKFHGIESFMGVTAGSQTPTDIDATVHADSYAGLSTVEGALSAETELTRIWTPNIINTGYTPASGQKLWQDYADEYLREGIVRGTFGQGEGDMPDLAVLNRTAYTQLLQLMGEKEQIMVNRGQAAALVSLGFKAVEFDGLPITWDTAVPTTDGASLAVKGYLLTTSRMKLMLANAKQLWETKVSFNDSYMADTIAMWCMGNLKFESPKFFGKFVSITAET